MCISVADEFVLSAFIFEGIATCSLGTPWAKILVVPFLLDHVWSHKSSFPLTYPHFPGYQGRSKELRSSAGKRSGELPVWSWWVQIWFWSARCRLATVSLHDFVIWKNINDISVLLFRLSKMGCKLTLQLTRAIAAKWLSSEHWSLCSIRIQR